MVLPHPFFTTGFQPTHSLNLVLLLLRPLSFFLGFRPLFASRLACYLIYFVRGFLYLVHFHKGHLDSRDIEILTLISLFSSLTLPGLSPGMKALYRSMIGVVQVLESLLDRTNKLRKSLGRRTLIQTITHIPVTMAKMARLLQTSTNANSARPHLPRNAFSRRWSDANNTIKELI